MREWFREISNAVALDSSSEGGSVVAYFRDLLYFAELAVFEQSIWADAGEQTNVLGAAGPLNETGGLLLCSSLRTEPAREPVAWTENEGNPSRLVERDDRLYGHGVLSGKVDLLCKLAAVQRIDRDSLRRPVWLVGLFGGELSSEAGGGLLMDHPVLRPSAALVGAPTNLELGVSHRGHLVFHVDVRRPRNVWRMNPAQSAWHVRFRGRPAPSAVPHRGENAARNALRRLEKLASNRDFTIHNLSSGGRANAVPGSAEAIVLSQHDEPPWNAPELDAPYDPRIPAAADEPVVVCAAAREDLELSYPVNDALRVLRRLRSRLESALQRPICFDDSLEDAGLFNLGTVQTCPDGLRLTYEFRATHDHDVESLVAQLESVVAEADASSAPLRVTMEVTKDQPPFAPIGFAGGQRLRMIARRALAAAGIAPSETVAASHTEAWIFGACGIESLVFGAGWVRHGSGEPHEHVSWAHLSAAAKFYEETIRQWCCTP